MILMKKLKRDKRSLMLHKLSSRLEICSLHSITSKICCPSSSTTTAELLLILFSLNLAIMHSGVTLPTLFLILQRLEEVAKLQVLRMLLPLRMSLPASWEDPGTILKATQRRELLKRRLLLLFMLVLLGRVQLGRIQLGTKKVAVRLVIMIMASRRSDRRRRFLMKLQLVAQLAPASIMNEVPHLNFLREIFAWFSLR